MIVVDVEPDTPEWEAERRGSVGASEAAALVGAATYGGTPLSVYLSKLGADRPFPEVLSYVTHAAEPLISGWVERFHPEIGTIGPGFMARHEDHPWLHATFDRVVTTPDGLTVPLQLKTSHPFARSSWDDGPPAQYLVQEDVECLVMGAPFAFLAVWHYGQDFDLHRLPARPERQAGVSEAARILMQHVRDRKPPTASLGDDIDALYPALDGTSVVATGDVIDAVEARTEAQIMKRENGAEYDETITAATFEIEKFMQSATHLIGPDGTVMHTWKPTKNGQRRHYTPGARERKS